MYRLIENVEIIVPIWNDNFIIMVRFQHDKLVLLTALDFAFTVT